MLQIAFYLLHCAKLYINSLYLDWHKRFLKNDCTIHLSIENRLSSTYNM